MFALNGESTPAVRKPVIEVSFGGQGASAGIAAAVGLGPGAGDPWARSVASVTVDGGLAPFVDVATVYLAGDEEAPELAIDDEGTISLGYSDSEVELVFTAKVGGIRHSVTGTRRLCGVNGGTLLSRLRINQSYEQQNAADIVSDLADQAGVATETVENGVDFPFYVIDDRQDAYRHITTLARKSGFVAYFTPAGKLYFGPVSNGQPVQTFSYALDIINLKTYATNPTMDSLTLVGAGAAGSQGQEAWPWLVKDPESITVQAGSGAGGRLVRDASLASAEAVQTAADGALAASARRATTGKMIVPGAPAVVAGSTIEIAEAPNAALNGKFLVARVRHEFSKQGGFTSCIDFNKTDGGGALGGIL